MAWGATGATVGASVGKISARGVGALVGGTGVEGTVTTVGVPLPPWVLTLDKAPAALGTSAASVEVPLVVWAIALDGVDDRVESGAGGNAIGVALPTSLGVSTLDNLAVAVGTGAGGTDT